MKTYLFALLALVFLVACAPHVDAPSAAIAPRVVHGGVFSGPSGGGGGGGGGTAPTALTFSLVDHAQARAFTWLNADYTVGIKFTPTATGVKVKGVRFFYDAPDHVARAVKVSLVNVTGASLIESVTSSTLAAGAAYEVDFASAHLLTAFTNYAVTARATTGIYAAFDSGSGLGPPLMNTSFPPSMWPWRVDGHVSLPLSCVVYTGTDNPAGVGANVEGIQGRIVPVEPVFSQ